VSIGNCIPYAYEVNAAATQPMTALRRLGRGLICDASVCTMDRKLIVDLYVCLLWLFMLLYMVDGVGRANIDFEEKSPFNQYLPPCTNNGQTSSTGSGSGGSVHPYIRKKTSSKAIVCPMFRDEEGFLSEWVAYYQMHGIDHIILFDDGSVDNSLREVQPWIDTGFVSVRRNWTTDELNVAPAFLKNDFKKSMTVKALLERECKVKAVEWGYKYHISLDIDEYVVPMRPGETLVDELERWVNETGRLAYCMDKLNFQQAPHTLEPVHLLTIEAYHSRMKSPARMNYYTNVAKKCAYVLQGAPETTNNTVAFVQSCCHFHGCQGYDFIKDDTTCKDHHNNEAWRVMGKGKKWIDRIAINHYSRSIEKYSIKSKTWKTATGEAKIGENSEQAAKSYDIPKFLSRNVGWYYDDSALRYSCQVRGILRNMTGEDVYLRPGLFWYRNPEFAREIVDPDKRGRYGRHNPAGFKFVDGNPYHFHGRGYVGKGADSYLVPAPVEAAGAADSKAVVHEATGKPKKKKAPGRGAR
jgi:Glycosyltransferase family 92